MLDQKVSYWLIKIMFPGEVESTSRSGVKSRFGMGFRLSDAILGLCFFLFKIGIPSPRPSLEQKPDITKGGLYMFYKLDLMTESPKQNRGCSESLLGLPFHHHLFLGHQCKIDVKWAVPKSKTMGFAKDWTGHMFGSSKH